VSFPKKPEEWLAGITSLSMKNVKKTRWSLEVATAISPLALFLSVDLSEGGFNNDQMFRLCRALGTNRPAELFEAEQKWWLALLDLAKSSDFKLFDSLGTWLKGRGVDDWKDATTFFTGSRVDLDASAAIVNLWQISTRQDLALGKTPLLATDLSDLSFAGTLLHVAKCHADPDPLADPFIHPVYDDTPVDHARLSSLPIFSFLDAIHGTPMVSIDQKIMVEPSVISHPIIFQIYTQHTSLHPHKFAVFDGSVGEAADRRHIHFLVQSKDCEGRCIYSVVNLENACGFLAFSEHIRAVLPGLLPEIVEQPPIRARRRPRTHQCDDGEDPEEESESFIRGNCSF
jgi:hypothetical protein